jgi:hypothetical protein
MTSLIPTVASTTQAIGIAIIAHGPRAAARRCRAYPAAGRSSDVSILRGFRLEKAGPARCRDAPPGGPTPQPQHYAGGRRLGVRVAGRGPRARLANGYGHELSSRTGWIQGPTTVRFALKLQPPPRIRLRATRRPRPVRGTARSPPECSAGPLPPNRPRRYILAARAHRRYNRLRRKARTQLSKPSRTVIVHRSVREKFAQLRRRAVSTLAAWTRRSDRPTAPPPYLLTSSPACHRQ